VRRLKACGIRSINNIVDITNYVMLEMGQPMHAFDINSIAGKHITVRRAEEGEKIITLDEQERKLDSSMLVIADKEKAVAIAGVMGGLNSEIEANTDTVVVESAVFNGGSIRKTAKKVGLRTESSSRFEKGLSPENALRAINRAVELVEMLGAGEAINGKIDVYPTKQEIKKVELNPDRINALLGINATKEEMIDILEKLDMKIENDVVTAPYFRIDVEQEADLAEEVLRFYGYDKLGSTLATGESTIGVRTKIQKIEQDLKFLMVSLGASEIYTYGFINENELKKCQIKKAESTIEIRNPLSEDYTIMRTTTIPSMMQMMATNYAKKNADVRLYDISRIYKNANNAIEEGNVPTEEKILTIGMYGKEDFYTLKGIIEKILTVANIARYEVVVEENNSSYHPGRCANIKIGNDIIATLGQIHPIVQENYGIKQEVYVAEVNISKIVRYAKTNKKYTPIPKFPAVERDIAMIVDEEITVGAIEKVIQKQAKKMLEEAKLFDVYRDEKIGENKKSIAYSLKFRAGDKTLTDEEINPVMEKIIAALEKELGAVLRK